jgi:hypothetical protein
MRRLQKTNTHAYEGDISHISKYGGLICEVVRIPEWVSYVSRLREDNKKRSRFLSTLYRLNQQKIIDP